MAQSQKSMVYIVAIIAIVVLVGIVAWFIREEQNDGIQIEIGSVSTELVHPVASATLPR